MRQGPDTHEDPPPLTLFPIFLYFGTLRRRRFLFGDVVSSA